MFGITQWASLSISSDRPRTGGPADAVAPHHEVRFRVVARGMGALAISIGGVVLTGWLAGIPLLRSLAPGWVEMKANTAFCLLLAGMALMLSDSFGGTSTRTRAGRVCAGLVFTVGAATFTEYIFGWNLGIDQLLFQEPPGAIGTSAPGRMAFSSALCFMLIGASLFLRHSSRPGKVRWAQTLSLTTALMGALSLLGYVYGVPAFQGVISYAPMAVHTAAGFVLLGLGVFLSSPGEGFMAVISSSSSGGLLARRMLPVVICLPPILGVLRLLGVRAGWFPNAFGISLKDGVMMVFLAAVVWISARSTNRFDDAQQELIALRSAAFEQLQSAHDVLSETNRELSDARAAADRANSAKSEFLSRMSHELRTPLNAILGFAQLLEMEDLDAEKKESVDEIGRGGRHLLALTNDILDIARIEAGRLSVSLEPVQLEDVLEESLSMIKPLADSAGIDLHSRQDSTWQEFVLADQQRLRQIVLNLLANAVKYNRAGGSVEIACGKGPDGGFRIRVADTGPGIAAEEMDGLFEPFQRLGAEQTEVEGTGLGLALSRRLAQAMGGSLTAESERGRGSTFTVELRGTKSPLEQPLPELTEAPSLLSAPGCVLYIEDNLPNIRLVERALSHSPEIELITATTGEAGLELARAHRPDVILVDLNLPDTYGGKVLARLRQDPTTATIPVIVLSADATPWRIKELLANGAHAYMTKPFDLRELLDMIHRMMSLQEVR